MYKSKGDNPPRLDFWEVGIYVLFGGLSFLIGLVVYVAGKVLAWPVRKTVERYRSQQVEATAMTDGIPAETPVAADVGSSPKVTQAQLPAVDWESPEIVPMLIRRIELQKGYVICRFWEQSGMVKGKLTVTSRTLQKALGKIVIMRDGKCDSIAQAVDSMRRQAEAVLASAPKMRQPESGAFQARVQDEVPQEIGQVPDMTSLPANQEGDVLEVPPYISGDGHGPGDLEPDPFEQFSVPESASKPVCTRKPGVEATKVSYRGTLISYGREPRKLDDPAEGERVIKHFCVRIFDRELQAEQQLWGNDLQRVVTEAGVSIGDEINIGVVGETPVFIKGKPKKKKVWALTKIGH